MIYEFTVNFLVKIYKSGLNQDLPERVPDPILRLYPSLNTTAKF